MTRSSSAWKSSFHGGHSGEFCDHATGTLREMVAAAIRQGLRVFGMTEHAPRYEDRYLFSEERDLGRTVERLEATFERYAAQAQRLQAEFSSEIVLVKGFETEAVPDRRYVALMKKLKEDFGFEYVVGSVHHVRNICIDAHPEDFAEAVEACGGIEALALEYYDKALEVIESLKPEIIGHLDLVTKLGRGFGRLDTPRIRTKVEEALAAAQQNDCLLDLNVYPLRRGQANPYPDPWIVETAHRMGLSFCLGDDSHSPETVGVGIEGGRQYLQSLGVNRIVQLIPDHGVLRRKTVPLA